MYADFEKKYAQEFMQKLFVTIIDSVTRIKGLYGTIRSSSTFKVENSKNLSQ